jgi:hypothetical protein
VFFIILSIILFGVGYYFGTEEAIEEMYILMGTGPIMIAFGIIVLAMYIAPEKFEKLMSEKDPEKARKNKIKIIAAFLIIIIIVVIIIVYPSILI